MLTVSPRSLTSSVDAAAEREAAAIERLAELTGDAPQPTRLQIALSLASEAAERGLAAPKRHPYAWQRSCEAHAKIATAPLSYLVWGPPASKRIPSENNVLRRAARQIRRSQLLDQLRNVPKSRWLGLVEAARLSGLGQRTLQRACEMGKLPARRVKIGQGRWYVRACALRAVLSAKIGGKPVAA